MLINNLDLTVKDVLSRKQFRKANILAGENGLDRKITWTHIIEHNDFETLINGNELILTTGSNIDLQTQASAATYHRLINKNVAGLCIEKGKYFHTLSPEIKKIADSNNFPIIVFNEIVKFVDITQDLHTLLVNQQNQMVYHLNQLSHQFNKHSLAPNGILKVLQELYKHVGQKVICLIDQENTYYYPPSLKIEEPQILAYFLKTLTNDDNSKIIPYRDTPFAIVPISVLGSTWGHLCIQVNSQMNDELFFSLMDRASMAIAQILLRNRTIEERRANSEDDLVKNLLQGRKYDEVELQFFLPTHHSKLSYRVIVIKTFPYKTGLGHEKWDEHKIQRTISIRSLFQQYGCLPVVSTRKNEIVIVCFFIDEDQAKKNYLYMQKIIDQMLISDANNILHDVVSQIGVSSVQSDIKHASSSYNEAIQVIKLRKKVLCNTYFFEDIGIFQLLLMQNNTDLKAFSNRYIGKLIDYDQKMGTELLKTLEIYLECQGAKKEAARRLFIVRQTLYHRLNKIEQLLNVELIRPIHRLSLETAIKSYYLLMDEKVDTQ